MNDKTTNTVNFSTGLSVHNMAQVDLLRDLYDREKWLLSEQAGWDLSQCAEGLMQIELRICELMPSFGAWMASLNDVPAVLAA